MQRIISFPQTRRTLSTFSTMVFLTFASLSFAKVDAPSASTKIGTSCEIHLGQTKTPPVTGTRESDYFEAHAAWVKSLNFKSGLKTRLADNPFLFPLLLSKAYATELSEEAAAKLQEVFYEALKSNGAELDTTEKAELETWLLNSVQPRALQALYAKATFKKLLSFESGTRFEGISIDGLADPLKERGSRWKQLLALPQTLRKLKKLTDEYFQTSTLDENLYAFFGFHQNLGDRFYGQRPWERMNLNTIDGNSIVNISDEEFVSIMIYAMEVEDPILGYSWASGQGFRFLLPNMGRFMGKNSEQAEHIRRLKAQGDEKAKWCESPWCEEERRHGNMWAKLTQLISGVDPRRDNPVVPHEPSPDEEGAQFHHYSRQSTEWSATASYLLLAVHADGDLEKATMNVAADEIKHLTLLTAAQAHLFGYSTWTRLKNMIQKSLAEFKAHKTGRSTGSTVGSNPITAFEIIVSHILIEMKMRKYMRTLPESTLRAFFESQSKLPEIEAVDVPADLRAQAEALQEAGAIIRQDYLRWSPKSLAESLKQVAFEKINKKTLDEIIREDFRNFEGAEEYDSRVASLYRSQLKNEKLDDHTFVGWTPNGPTDENLRRALWNRLREFQITNNAHVREVREKAAAAAELERIKAAAAAAVTSQEISAEERDQRQAAVAAANAETRPTTSGSPVQSSPPRARTRLTGVR
jgi:hypothetical protein